MSLGRRCAALAITCLVSSGVVWAECDKLSITDAKALAREQLLARICRDAKARNAYVDAANAFLVHRNLVQSLDNGMRVTSDRNFYGAWLAALRPAAECSAAIRSNSDAYSDLYGEKPSGCEEPRVAQRLELMR